MSAAQTATILFTDVVGSTDLANRVGDRECRRLLGAHEAVIREGFAKHVELAERMLVGT